MSRRSCFASRLTLWTFAVALVLKSAVPMLAAAAAGLQGKAVADVCSVYGVRLASASGDAHGGESHVMEHMAGMAMPVAGGDPHSHHEPADQASHAQDHCALTGLAACAVFTTTLSALVYWIDGSVVSVSVFDVVKPPQDASARWLTSRLHAPPRSA